MSSAFVGRGRRERADGGHRVRHAQAGGVHPPRPGSRETQGVRPAPSLGLGDLPERQIRPFGLEDLLALPAGYGGGDEMADREAHVWSYQQTDPNPHIHAMEYVRVMEAFAAEQLARRGRSPREYYFARARILFRRPSFTGQWYRRTARRFAGQDGAELLIGAIHPVPDPDAPLAGTPTTVVQLYARKSLLSPSRSDKRP